MYVVGSTCFHLVVEQEQERRRRLRHEDEHDEMHLLGLLLGLRSLLDLLVTQERQENIVPDLDGVNVQ